MYIRIHIYYAIHKFRRGCVLLQHASVKDTLRPAVFGILTSRWKCRCYEVLIKYHSSATRSISSHPHEQKRFAYCHALTGAWALARIISRRGRRKHIYHRTGRGTNALICAENRPCPEIKGRDKSISRAAKCFPNLSRPSPFCTLPLSLPTVSSSLV